MYVETDVLLALIKDEDGLGEPAEAVYREYSENLWTSPFTLIELLLVAYREARNAERVVTNAVALTPVRDATETIVAAATYVEERGLTPFDALHLVESDGETIVSSDAAYESSTSRLGSRRRGKRRRRC